MVVRSLAGRQAEMTKGVWEKVPNFSALLLVFAFRRGIIAAKQELSFDLRFFLALCGASKKWLIAPSQLR